MLRSSEKERIDIDGITASGSELQAVELDDSKQFQKVQADRMYYHLTGCLLVAETKLEEKDI